MSQDAKKKQLVADPHRAHPNGAIRTMDSASRGGPLQHKSGSNAGKMNSDGPEQNSESFGFKHEDVSLRNSRFNSITSVVEGLPPQKRSGELPRGSSSSSSGDSPMFEISRTARKSGEISRVSISSGASFSGEIPRASSSSGEIVEGLRSQRRNGDDGVRAAGGNRKSGEIYQGNNSSGGSSSGGSPTPEIFNRGSRKNGEGGVHGSNSSAGSSDGGSPTAESLWGNKGGVILNTGMVTGGSFSSFSSVANGGNHADGSSTRKEKPVAAVAEKAQNGSAHVQEFNGTRLNVNATAGVASSRFLVGAAASTEIRTGIRTSGSSNLGSRNVLDARSVPNTEEVKNLGNVEYKKGNFAKALALYDRAISLCPDQAAYRCNRAAALAGLGRLGEAVQESEMAVKLDPSFTRAYQRLVSLHIRLGQVPEARKYLKSAGQQNDVGDAHRANVVERRLASSFEARKLRDWASVVKECDAAIVAGADHSLQIFVLKAEALLRLHRLDDADAVLAAAQRVEEASSKAARQEYSTSLLVLKAQADMAQGRFEDAVSVAERAARLEPKNFEVCSLLRKARTVSKARTTGNEFFKAGKFFEACAAYTEGLELDPANAVLLCNRAASRSKLGQWEKTLEDCNAALQVQPNYTKALLRRAHSYSKLERWEDAARDYEAIRREHPGDVEVAQALFDVQVALKKSRGEEICRSRFGGGVEEVSRNDQFREAISCPGLSVVEFTTRWSDRCRQFSAFVEELCRRYPSVNFSKVDVDDSPYLAQLESITSVPTFKIFRNGVNVKELLGPSQQGLELAVKQCGV